MWQGLHKSNDASGIWKMMLKARRNELETAKIETPRETEKRGKH